MIKFFHFVVFFTIFFFLRIFYTDSSSNLYYLNFEKEKIDSTSIQQIAPGIKHIHLIKSEYPWNINILEINLKSSNIEFETVKGRDKLFDSREKLTEMIHRKSDSSHKVLFGVNSDFFSMKNGDINNNQISNYIFVKGITTSRYQFGITKDNVPFIESFKFTGKIYGKNKKSMDIKAINFKRGKDSLVLYNSFWGNSTSTTREGTELTIKTISGWKVNEKIRAVVLSRNESNTTISSNNAVLSGNGIASDFLNKNYKIGDTISIYLGTIPKINNLKECIGGMPLLINKGSNVTISDTTASIKDIKKEGGSSLFITNKHPRTAIGFVKDKTKLFLICVDGRQKSSIGISLPDLSRFMINLGIYQGLNFDGGGSTTMVIHNKIVNLTSDMTGERAIGNALLIFDNSK